MKIKIFKYVSVELFDLSLTNKLPIYLNTKYV